jgi:hypothetical protein
MAMLQSGVPWLADGYHTKLFASEPIKRDKVLPSDNDNFALLPEEDAPSFVSFRVSTPTPLAAQRRVKSATTIRIQNRYERPRTAHGNPSVSGKENAVPARPSSARIQSTAAALRMRQRRVKSASSVRSSTATKPTISSSSDVVTARKSFTLVNRLYEDEYLRSAIHLHPEGPGPDYRYFDRHSRCLDHTHMHTDLMLERPSTACSNYPPHCDDIRPASVAGGVVGTNGGGQRTPGGGA